MSTKKHPKRTPIRLSTPLSEIEGHYPVLVVGSGYGGSIVASRLARAGQKVCLLERGKERQPGEFPDELGEAAESVQISGPRHRLGRRTGLYDFRVYDDVDVVVGCGLGGTSLINANVSIEADPRVFDDPVWPRALRDDVANGALGRWYEDARAMLRPRPYPEGSARYPVLPKTEALRASAARLKRPLRLVDINVNFDVDGPNHVGVEQRPCDGCGDCCSGCNLGAKNTTLMTYLPDAVRHGAKLFTRAEVKYVERDEAAGNWKVFFEALDYGRDAFRAPPLVVRADHVFLSAGTLGSTEILLRSRARGLPTSDQLGRRFSGNGDVLGFSYNGKAPVKGVGWGPVRPAPDAAGGPCITAVIDGRDTANVDDGRVLEDGSIPGALARLLPAAFEGATKLDEGEPGQALRERLAGRLRVLQGWASGGAFGATQNTQTLLGMSHDGAAGQIELDGDALQIRWPGYGGLAPFAAFDRDIREASQAIGASYVKNPLWSDAFGNKVVTVHPLGGCPMGDDAERGAVDHRGQVFRGPGGADLHPGLYVADGSVIPRSLGANPLLTISALAERACDLIAAEQGWVSGDRIERGFEASPGAPGAPRRPRISFTERMAGYVAEVGPIDDDTFEGEARFEAAAERGRREGSAFEFVLTIEAADIERFFESPGHEARAIGTVIAPSLSPSPLAVEDGRFQLFVADPDDPGVRTMKYALRLRSAEGKVYFFDAFKRVRDDVAGPEIWADTSTLYVSIYEGAEVGAKAAYRGVLRIEAADFTKQLATLAAADAAGPIEAATLLARFGRHFAGSLWGVYGPAGAGRRGRGPAPRPKERLVPLYTLAGVKDAAIEVLPFETADNLGLSLTRYRRKGAAGRKPRDSVLIVHGLTTSSDMYIMPEHDNLVQYLLDHGYDDVWTLDTRMSNRFSYNLWMHRFTMDDMAMYDFPAALARVRREVDGSRIHVICHCLGSVSFMMSLFGKRVSGVASVIANSVSLTPRVPAWSRFKLTVMPFLFERFVGLPYINPRWSDDPYLTPGKLISKAVDLFHPENDVPACHMLSFMWGAGRPALYNQENLDPITHRRSGDLYGATSVHYYRHVAKMVRAGRAVPFAPREPRYQGLPKDYLEYAADIETPVLFMTGRDNRVFADSNVVAHATLERLAPGRHELYVVPGYGHQDVFMGKNVARDVFPRLLDFLERHRAPRPSTRAARPATAPALAAEPAE